MKVDDMKTRRNIESIKQPTKESIMLAAELQRFVTLRDKYYQKAVDEDKAIDRCNLLGADPINIHNLEFHQLRSEMFHLFVNTLNECIHPAMPKDPQPVVNADSFFGAPAMVPLVWESDMAKSHCTCGHTGDGARSDHYGETGHGACAVAGCKCGQFTWKAFTPLFQDHLKNQ
jgi:hypothetical protein